jgi:pyridoxal phosphate enzyme (YggS family)
LNYGLPAESLPKLYATARKSVSWELRNAGKAVSMSDFEKLTENLAALRGRIAAAAKRSGRSTDEIRLVAVTKYVGPELARQLVTAGCQDLGESRPQELWDKAVALDEASDRQARWHLIGHLQRNKVDRTLPLVSLIHSGDSMRILTAIDQAAAKLNQSVPILLEVNISEEPAKHGFAVEEVRCNLPAIAELKSIEVRGLMCMAGREGDLDQARREFAQLRELRDRLRQVTPANIRLDELSMGMSGDFEAAIEEGATIVRIGSALFEGIMPE